MCGITGLISIKNVSIKKYLLETLKRLEYRGYDSLGFVGDDYKPVKSTEKITPFLKKFKDFETKKGLAHSRWATHGGISELNAHPHYDKSKKIFVVHNGIIENYSEIKEKLQQEGCSFKTKTDTELIPHYMEHKLREGKSVVEAIKDFFNEIEGTFAILMMINGEDKIYALKRDSPLVIGIGEGMTLVGSDVYAFNNITNKAIFFEDNEFAIIKPDKYQFYDSDGEPIEKEIMEIELDHEEDSKKDYPHYMIKEIEEQPYVAKRLIDSFETSQKENFSRFVKLIKSKKRITFLSCGTSYHASLIGAEVLKEVGVRTKSVVASEWEHFIEPDKDTLVIAISQSGETMDVVKPLKNAKKKGATVACLVNVPFSTIQRLSDVSINILAGPEIAVASTKAFTNQVISLFRLAQLMGFEMDIESIPQKLKETLKFRGKCKELAKDLSKRHDIYILGRHFAYPVAREIALKFKEVDYIHAEGMMAGELKHGTLALIEKDVPVISLIYNNNSYMRSSNQEVKARGAKTYLIGNKGEMDFLLPECNVGEFAIYSVLIGHLLSYEIGVIKGVEIDQCRNLAKSVTVL